jgi:xanthine dehydrogenase accessory factor
MNTLQIYKKAAKLLKKGDNIAMSTVISTTGSTPGKVGYKMLIWGKKPETFATVGGGFCEAQIISKAEKILPEIKNQVLKFNLDGTEFDEKGICGGTIEFLIETFDLKSLPLFEEISNCIMNGKNGILLSIISPESSPEKIFFKNVEEIYSHTSIGLSPEICQSIKKIYDKGQSGKIRLNNNLKIFIETFSQQPMVYIFGAGHLSY